MSKENRFLKADPNGDTFDSFVAGVLEHELGRIQLALSVNEDKGLRPTSTKELADHIENLLGELREARGK